MASSPDPGMGAWQLLDPGEGCCPVCGDEHPPEYPHNPGHIYWQMLRAVHHEPSPTWNEAMAHVSEEMRESWVGFLDGAGIPEQQLDWPVKLGGKTVKPKETNG